MMNTQSNQHMPSVMQQNLFPEIAVPAHSIIEKLTPAALAEEPADFLSKRYGHIKTHTIIGELLKMGFTYQSGNSRGGKHSKHVAILEHPSAAVEGDGLVNTENWSMNVVITNSHDGSTKFAASLGLVGENGIAYALGGKWSSIQVRHNIHVAKEAPLATKNLISEAPKAAAIIELLKGVTLSKQQKLEYANFVAALRWRKKLPIDPKILIESCNSNVLFDVMTHLQQQVLDGRIATLKNRFTRRYSRPADRIRIMRELWARAEEMTQ